MGIRVKCTESPNAPCGCRMMIYEKILHVSGCFISWFCIGFVRIMIVVSKVSSNTGTCIVVFIVISNTDEIISRRGL